MDYNAAEAMRFLFLTVGLSVLVAVGCSRGESIEDKTDKYHDFADVCLEKSGEEFRQAQRILDAFGAEHGRDANFVQGYLQLERRLKDPIEDAAERCLDDALEKAGLSE